MSRSAADAILAKLDAEVNAGRNTSQPMRVGQMIARIAELEAALREIAGRGPVAGHASADALRLRLVGSQSIARRALKVSP